MSAYVKKLQFFRQAINRIGTLFPKFGNLPWGLGLMLH
jgi:hypothetical protein